MSLPTIALVNFSSHVGDQRVQEAIRAVNRQVLEDFAPVWGSGRVMRLHAPAFDPADPDTLMEDPIGASAVVYLVDQATLPGALGYHDLNTRAIPVGFVFVLDLAEWTTTLSHEVLELIVDPTVNIFVPGPDPRDASNFVLHAYEVCDAVERTSYEIDGVRVSNFVTPEYFTVGDEIGTRNDFLGVGVTSFGVTRGSHIAFFDLSAGEWVTVLGEHAPPQAAQARRAHAFDRPKPSRPADTELDAILATYNQAPRHGCKGLHHLASVTRTGRYRASAVRINGRRTAVRL